MKVVFVCLVFVGLALAKPAGDDDNSRGCRYIEGRCVEKCPVGTHAYTTGCSYLTPEATCANPNPKQDTRGKLCDFSACYCDAPTVRDEKTNQCVSLDKCSK
ncbi:uncharacterized protein LOC125230547 isoform X1 [Leguminivora glycinivorella]|uniref:uncharacterized protein LOC125230547 isoform X1 n=1 Tax=Leguminivora glycinivorella TaxID=1035111 RepID=UPI00200CED0F|nr:uncharacterized protein LOC125230547 isoform X1 [Leguminivora glycinivorella]